MVIGLHHVHIFCGDVEKTAEYFKDVFDAGELHRGRLGGRDFIRIGLKGLIINLTGTEAGAGVFETGKGNRGLDHFSLRVEDMDGTVARMHDKGVRIVKGPGVSDTGNKYLFVEGPDGIKIELLELKSA